MKNVKLSEKQYVSTEIEIIKLSNEDVVLDSPVKTGKEEWD